METKIERREAMRGGKGHVILEHILGASELNGKCRLYAKITLEPGCSIGYHEHHGESETFYVLSGQGEYDENGTLRSIQAGEVTHTPNGGGHGIENTGSVDLVFMALIIMA